MALLTMNAQTGELKTFNPSNDWDNHFLCSPTDPNVLMYCNEGRWQNNDRIWTINLDGTNLQKLHTRTMINEIWGHEFWSPDGAVATKNIRCASTNARRRPEIPSCTFIPSMLRAAGRPRDAIPAH